MTDAPTILLVEDDEILASSLKARLTLEGMIPVHAGTCEAAIEALENRDFDAVVSDIRLPDGSGEDVFWAERARFAMTPTIFATAYGDVEQAVRLVKVGAIDYLTKPYDLGALVDLLRRVTGHPEADVGSPEFVAASPAMQRVASALDRLADDTQNVLFVGPSGSGRQALARRLHALSTRAADPFVVIEGAALTAAGGDRLLFGSREGDGHEPGLVDGVGVGTLLVTDVSDIAPELQARLLRFAEDHRYRPVGATAEKNFVGRIMATSRVSPTEAGVAPGSGTDLLHRLAVIELRLPPLAERDEDIVPLAEHFLRLCDRATPRTARHRLSAEATAALRDHSWPGNVRELRNRIVRAVTLASEEELTVADLFPDQPTGGDAADHKLDTARRDAERQAIEAALAENHGRIVDTAKALGISRVTLWSKMKRFGIAKPDAER
ncbi:sigma-54-dependent transcriptional regulator [Pinisolibacter sp.]|uniref:sigma-54-dependent transcriptional regulator n=1 Tax=Pinisolibacter sp. TaxID=2172024 RepID=UPI002FDF0191